MKRRGLVRFQLVALAVAVVLLVYRVVQGQRGPEGLLVLSDLGTSELRHEAFVLERPALLAIEATGSLEDARDGVDHSTLAAYGWILRRDDRRTVWRMRPDSVEQVRGTQAHALDTLALEPGTYDVYFTSYGNAPQERNDDRFVRRITDSRRRWQNDARKWSLAIRSADGGLENLRRPDAYNEDEDGATAEGQLWPVEPARSQDRVIHLFEVIRPASVEVYGIGEFQRQPKDYGWIEDAVTGDRQWEMTAANTVPAGGAPMNRLFRGPVSLSPGLYRAVFETDDNHAFDDWAANPPFDPRGWGLSLAVPSSETGAVRPFDPWTSRKPLVSILRVPSSRRRSVQFTVPDRLPVMVQATGEVGGDNLFDFGWLVDESGREVWKMSADASEPAGGADKNRQETAFLTLEPGTYTLYYQTDDTHAFDDWNEDQPAHPGRWGVALFPLQASVPSGAVTILKEGQEKIGDDMDTPPAPARHSSPSTCCEPVRGQHG